MEIESDQYNVPFDTSLTSLPFFQKCQMYPCENMTNICLAKVSYQLRMFDCGGASSPTNLVLCGACYATHCENVKEEKKKGRSEVVYHFRYNK